MRYIPAVPARMRSGTLGAGEPKNPSLNGWTLGDQVAIKLGAVLVPPDIRCRDYISPSERALDLVYAELGRRTVFAVTGSGTGNGLPGDSRLGENKTVNSRPA